ncbi:hypothetical protein CAP36_00390 [Chitinophagaceae bacterium IBVUCB2]|nr:hypothetical protein CAP36_00390 [Chitinophagaceae bacterium IBVUCB2]
MIVRTIHWQKLFFFCLGLFVGTAFCMKWMESDFVLNGDIFTIIGLEKTYSREKVSAILTGLDSSVKNILQYHLAFDFAFMVGVYPGIAALCMLAREKYSSKILRNILFGLAALQTVAFVCDVVENIYLFNWIKNPEISSYDFSNYHIVVITKWIIALTGALMAIPLSLKRQKKI